MAGLAINQSVRSVEDITGCHVIEVEVLRPTFLRLCEGASPLSEEDSGSGQNNEEQAGKIFHGRGTSLNRLITFVSVPHPACGNVSRATL
jgi:hypothetical protein